MNRMADDFYDDLAAAESGYQGAQAATSDRVAADFEWAFETLTGTEAHEFDANPADEDYGAAV